jgi:hypothetical protein
MSSFAQDSEKNIFEYTREMYKKVNSISELKPEEFNGKIAEIRVEIDKYIEHKKGVCQGDFSTVILEQSQAEKSEYKLTKSEQELCYRELKALQITYINKLFTARKNYLDHLHAQRIKKLGAVREEALKQLQSTFDKKVRHRRRSRSSKKRK